MLQIVKSRQRATERTGICLTTYLEMALFRVVLFSSYLKAHAEASLTGEMEKEYVFTGHLTLGNENT